MRGFCALCLWMGIAACAPADEVLRLVPEDPDLDELAWLAGSWGGVMDGGRVEEHWTAPAGGSMIGVNRTVVGGRTVFFEYLRIEASDAGIVYLASPLGRDPPTAFRMTAMAPRQVTFENPEHDYPQRITYARQGDTLRAFIAGQQDGKEQGSAWTMVRAQVATTDE